MKNQHGFIYPTALCLLIITISVFLIHMEMYVSEQRMYHQVLIQEDQQLLFLRSSARISEQIRTNQLSLTGQFIFEHEVITYELSTIAVNQYQAKFSLIKDQKQITATAIYEMPTGKLVEWSNPI